MKTTAMSESAASEYSVLGMRCNLCKGFALVELAIVVAITVILLALAVPSAINIQRKFRLASDARTLAAQLNLARMRAASAGTKTRLNVSLTANTFQIERWNTGAGAYQIDQGGVQYLRPGDTFGYGSITTAAGQQSSIAQGYPSESGCTCIYFNSRGIATDSSGNATANSAIYITNGKNFSAITVSLGGQVAEYNYSGSAWGRF